MNHEDTTPRARLCGGNADSLHPAWRANMAPLTAGSRDWLTQHHHAILITLRADGSPQSSNVLTSFDGDDFRVSVTAERAKTRNLARDSRAIMHVLGASFWSYASVTCSARLGDVSTLAGDQAGLDLLKHYNEVSETPHPNPQEFLDVQVTEHRLLLTLRAEAVSGMGWDN